MYFKTLFVVFAEWITKISISASWVLKPRKIFLSGLELALPTLIPSQPVWQMFLQREWEKAIFYLGLWAKCKFRVAVWHPFLLGNPHQLSVTDISACKPQNWSCVDIWGGGGGIYLTVAVVLQDLLSTCAVSCLPSVLTRKLLLRFLLLNIGYAFFLQQEARCAEWMLGFNGCVS